MNYTRCMPSFGINQRQRALSPQEKLALVLMDIEVNDTNYGVRYNLVFEALALALKAGYQAGVRVDPAEPKWPVVQIELPTGQVSWHMPAHEIPYDGHSTEEKYRRINAYATSVFPTTRSIW